VSWKFPLIVWLVSFAFLWEGVRSDSTLIDIAFVMIVTSLLITLLAFGTATSVMEVEVSSSSGQEGKSRKTLEEFFPKGAIAFFVSMLVFFGGTWLALYALMLYRIGI